MDIRAPRDGKTIEELGTYDPTNKDAARVVKLNEERVKYWLSVGAQPSDTVRSLLRKTGILPAAVAPKAKA
jgi:small subunit ribosomal protein S16